MSRHAEELSGPWITHDLAAQEIAHIDHVLRRFGSTGRIHEAWLAGDRTRELDLSVVRARRRLRRVRRVRHVDDCDACNPQVSRFLHNFLWFFILPRPL